MNLDEFRALKAQEESQKTEETQVAKEEVKVEPTQTTETTEIKTEETNPNEIEIDGIGKVEINELKNGYLRQSDYTKKTQEISKLRKEAEEAMKIAEFVKSNPQLAQSIGVEPINPFMNKISELEEQLYDMKLEKEIETLTNKYPDFEVLEVLQVAHDKGLTNLEDAYKIVKSNKPVVQPSVNIDEIREQIKNELLKEFGVDENTKIKTVISNGANAQITNNAPSISEAEAKVARFMNLTPEEYIKWRDIESK